MNNIILIAPPAAGKGTQAALLKEKYNMVHISTGDLLRLEAQEDTERGKYIADLLSHGKLIDDSIVLELLEKKLNESDCDNGYILDGFPRTKDQAILLDELSNRLNKNIDYVIFLDIDRDKAMKRSLGRVSCPECKAIYNEYFDTFKEIGFCNKCGTKLDKRTDDNEETFNNRYDSYIKMTEPVVEYYKSKGILHIVDSSFDKEYTLSQIEKIIGDNND